MAAKGFLWILMDYLAGHHNSDCRDCLRIGTLLSALTLTITGQLTFRIEIDIDMLFHKMLKPKYVMAKAVCL